MPATCAITRELTKCFVGLQQTAEYARAFPEGTVRRFIMDDQMRNNQRVAEGRSKHSFRYNPVTLKFAMRLLIKNGQSGYEELRQVLNLPSTRYLRDFTHAHKDEKGRELEFDGSPLG